ncbi:MAG: hypothetical protein IJB57_07155 [Clostridia bacterium]|nr:hypothetical protein [Clostridia bacterium]
MAENIDNKKEKKSEDEKPRIKPGDIICKTETCDTVSMGNGNVMHKSDNKFF